MASSCVGAFSFPHYPCRLHVRAGARVSRSKRMLGGQKIRWMHWTEGSGGRPLCPECARIGSVPLPRRTNVAERCCCVVVINVIVLLALLVNYRGKSGRQEKEMKARAAAGEKCPALQSRRCQAPPPTHPPSRRERPQCPRTRSGPHPRARDDHRDAEPSPDQREPSRADGRIARYAGDRHGGHVQVARAGRPWQQSATRRFIVEEAYR